MSRPHDHQHRRNHRHDDPRPAPDAVGGDAGPPTTTRRRRRRRHHRALAAAATAAVALVALPTSAAADPAPDPQQQPGDPAVIWEWNAVAMDVLTPSTRPLLTQLFVVAAMHVAMYDAVVAVDGYARPFGTDLTAPAGASAEAAAAVAAHRVLVEFLPADAAVFDAALEQDLAALPDGPSKADGIALGEAAGWGTLAHRSNDGSQAGPTPPLPAPAPGVWVPTPPATSGHAPWLAQARPFALRAADQFRPQAPPRLGSRRYEQALDEVRRLGGTVSAERTAEQTAIARFWSDQPVAQNQRTLRTHAAALDWGLAPTARFFAAVLTSEADALIACWDAKYTYLLWRPWQAVPTVEPGWTPLLGTPNHPEYPSAHSCLSGSLAFAVERVMGTHRIELDVDAANVAVTRHFATTADLLEELTIARISGGLHYRFSIEAGLRLAERVVDHNLRRNFRLDTGR